MSRDELPKQLRGKRTEVETAAKAISAQFEQIRKGGTTSVVLRYEINVLRHLCCALQDNNHKYADIYCDIAASMLPHVAPCPTKPEFWTNHVISLHFIHHSLCQEQTIKQCQRFYALINAQRCQLQGQAEYKSYMGIHIKHLYYFCQQMQKEATPEAKEQLCQAIQALGVLFEAMLHLQSQQPNIIYVELIVELNQLLGKRSSRFLKILGTLPVKYLNKLCDPLFKLIASNGLSAELLLQQFPEYLSALLALLQLDGYALQQSPMNWSIQLLRSCRELYKNQSAQNYPIQLLYYYLKLICAQETPTTAAAATASSNLKLAYIDLTKKFVHYFEQKAAAHAQEPWFIDFVLSLVRLQKQLHQVDSRLPNFNGFWQGLEGEDSAAVYAAHFALLQCLISVSMDMSSNSSSRSLAPNCSNDPNCQSVRKHCIFSLGYCATVAYSNWQPTGQATLQKAQQMSLVSIMRYAMDVAKVTKCMLPSSEELIGFIWHVTNIADKVATARQMCLVQQLLQPLQQLRPLLGKTELRQLLRRLYKASAHCSVADAELAAQLHCSYIAHMDCPSRRFNLMCVYYHKCKQEVQKCVYELHESSPLRNPLDSRQRRKLYELDMLAVLAHKKTPPMLQSLLRHRQTDYQAVLLARQMRSDKPTIQQFEELRVKLQRTGRKQKLSRLQQLVLGHASVTKLLESLEAQKMKIPIKETTEKSLEQMLIKHKILHINISSEMPLVELATAAIGAFEDFFNRADAEPLSSDEALIDWDALIDDGTATAMALSTMGYTTQADRAWLLLLRICRLLGDRFNYLRALSHFLARYTQHTLLDLPHEVLHAEQLMDELWPQLHAGHFFKRHHTTLLLCLCHLALYYARLDRISHAQLLLLHAERLRDGFEERVGKCDIVQLTLLTVRFRMCYQQRHCRLLARLPTSLQQLDTLSVSVRKFIGISSMDQGALILLLNDLVRDTTECTANRLSECPNFSSSLLQLLLQSGMVLRAVEVLISWLWTNLRMEYLDKAHSKLRLIEHFLCMQPLLESIALQEQHSKSCHLSAKTAAAAAPMDAQTQHMSELVGRMFAMQLEQQSAASVEPIRKQQQLAMTTSPRLELRPPRRNNRLKLQRYVQLDTQESHPVLRGSIQLQCVYFVVGCLHARLDFLNREHDQLDDFYALAKAWLQQDGARSNGLGHLLMLLHMYQANYLRATCRKQQAIELLTASTLQLNGSQHLQQRVDVNYRYNLLLQLRSAQLELQPPPPPAPCNKSQNPRRALKFNISPEEKTPVATAATKTGAKSKQKTTRKPAAFAIYTEDAAVASCSTSSSSSSERGNSPDRQKSTKSRSNKRLDLNACQLIIDLSDDEPQQLKISTSVTNTRLPRTRSQKATETQLASVRRIATTPKPSSSSSSSSRANAAPEETPGTASSTISTRGRIRRQPAAATPVLQADSISTRRRQRN
ncbi:protein three rows [Drosophila grimshawi]|uniref:GH19844 n=1 Tax=Drosophila grimshawi TaxID=7222 RepID=B4J9K7_DROGR|nr:protein three rows [Drosophila grimshawi]EDW02514.1 GH19844 [Drosophila grimshawi]